MHREGRVDQVGSLPQFFLDISFWQWKKGIFFIVFQSSFLTNTQSRFASVFLHAWTSKPSTAHLTVSLLICSSKSNVQGEIDGPKRGRCQLEKPLKGPTFLLAIYNNRFSWIVVVGWHGVDIFACPKQKESLFISSLCGKKC